MTQPCNDPQRREGFGRMFEDFEIGAQYKHWPGKTITEAECSMFSLITMNHHPLHFDAAYAATTQHGRILVVGTLVFSLVVGMSVRDVSGRAIANLEYESVAHNGPVFIGDTIYGETDVLDKRASSSKPDRGIVYVETRGLNQHGETILTFRRRVLVPKRHV
jgi:acyl dehydratase